jgi:sugar/nucleoside kinase (ribokinase family)
MGKVGDDLLGEMILRLLSEHDAMLAEGMIVAPGQASSYTIVISPPGVDRCFLHCTGTNDTFVAADLLHDRMAGARMLHFGYPTLMQGIYDGGAEGLSRAFAEARRRSIAVSLDMGMPDASSPAAAIDWSAWLARVLPEVDVFLPSLDEALLTLDRPRYEELVRRSDGGNPAAAADNPLLDELSERLLELGARIVVLKLGDQGLYLRTGEDAVELAGGALCARGSGWQNRQLAAPCFEVEVVGATGSGDCTIGGFLAGLAKGLSPEATLLSAVAVGACNVQSADATSGIPAWNEVQTRMQTWHSKAVRMQLAGWRRDEQAGISIGPHDRQ